MQRQPTFKGINLKYVDLEQIEKYLSAAVIPYFNLDDLDKNYLFTDKEYRDDILNCDKKKRKYKKIKKILSAIGHEEEIRWPIIESDNDNTRAIISDSNAISIFDSHHQNFCEDILLQMLNLFSVYEVTRMRKVSKKFDALIDKLPVHSPFILIQDYAVIRIIPLKKFNPGKTLDVKCRKTCGEIKPYIARLIQPDKNPDLVPEFITYYGEHNKEAYSKGLIPSTLGVGFSVWILTILVSCKLFDDLDFSNPLRHAVDFGLLLGGIVMALTYWHISKNINFDVDEQANQARNIFGLFKTDAPLAFSEVKEKMQPHNHCKYG
jgi:hypothetical protein